MSTLTIGTDSLTFYNNTRNFIELPYEDVKFTKVYNPSSIAVKPLFPHKDVNSFIRTIHIIFSNIYLDMGIQKPDVLHFWNTVSTGKTPWVTTLEETVPRYETFTKKGVIFGLKLLAGSACKQLICLSEHNYARQLATLAEHPDYEDAIASKLTILHPQQKPLINSYDDKELDDETIVFTIVGGHFFRKGGRECIDAVARLADEGYNLKLKIISALEVGDYASYTADRDRNAALELIEKYPDHIEYLGPQPNEVVTKVLIDSHVGLLPTYDDSYGYSLLESQAAGCPVISTRVRALPEINYESVGWLIDVPTDSLGYTDYAVASERLKLSASIREGLYHIMKSIVENPEKVREKGENSLERIMQYHNPEERAHKLEDLYQTICNETFVPALRPASVGGTGRFVTN